MATLHLTIKQKTLIYSIFGTPYNIFVTHVDLNSGCTNKTNKFIDNRLHLITLIRVKIKYHTDTSPIFSVAFAYVSDVTEESGNYFDEIFLAEIFI